MSDADSDSDSVSSRRIPSDEILEKGLRDTVAAIFKRGNLDELTVKRVRSRTEKALGLEEGFYKNDEVWKARSDQIIKREAVGASFHRYLIFAKRYVSKKKKRSNKF